MPDTVDQLAELLDAEASWQHRGVYVEDKAGQRYRMELVETTDEHGDPCVVLRATGDRVSE
jgi:hypothetical protein